MEICVASHAENPRNPIHQKCRGECAEHQVFRARFQRDRIASRKADEHIKRYRYQLERDENRDKIDGRNEVHQSGTREVRECEEFSESVIALRKGTAYYGSVIDHHDQHEDCRY